MRNYRQERYYRLKESGCCVCCSQADENTKAGHAHCTKCARKILESNKKRQHERKAAHCCVRCGAQDKNTLRGAAYCFSCAVKNSKFSRKSQKKKTAESGNSQTV